MYGTYTHNLNISQYKKEAQELWASEGVKYTGAKNFNYFVNATKDTTATLSKYCAEIIGSTYPDGFEWDFQYFHSGEPAGLHTDYTIVPYNQEKECRVDIGIIIPLEWNCKQPYTINYNRIESLPRKAIFRKGEMRYTDNDEIINYRNKKELDDEVAKYNPKDTQYYKLYYDLKVHSVYEWKLGTAMVFDTKRWHSSSWFLSDNMLLNTSTEYKRAIIGFGSTDILIGK